MVAISLYPDREKFEASPAHTCKRRKGTVKAGAPLVLKRVSFVASARDEALLCKKLHREGLEDLLRYLPDGKVLRALSILHRMPTEQITEENPMKCFALILTAACFAFGSAVADGAQSSSYKPQSQRQPHVLRTSQERPHGFANPGVGLIPRDRYHADFGEEHKFHLEESSYGHDRHFRHGGYSFGFADEWPTNWLPSEDLFVVQVDGGYYLCNSTYPGVNIPLTVTQ